MQQRTETLAFNIVSINRTPLLYTAEYFGVASLSWLSQKFSSRYKQRFKSILAAKQ